MIYTGNRKSSIPNDKIYRKSILNSNNTAEENLNIEGNIFVQTKHAEEDQNILR